LTFYRSWFSTLPFEDLAGKCRKYLFSSDLVARGCDFRLLRFFY